MVDPEKAAQILINLVSNSIKFTSKGGQIWVRTDFQDRQIVILVQDTGVGVPPDQLEVIFEPFRQVDTSLTRQSEGTGLGLAISRQMARRMRGDITAESVMEMGTTMKLFLPLAPPPPPPPRA